MTTASSDCFADTTPRVRRGRSDEIFSESVAALLAANRAMHSHSDDESNSTAALFGFGVAERRARMDVRRLKKRGLINAAVARDAIELVRFLFKANTIYATTTNDDGGVIFYWKAGSMTIEIDVFPGEGFWWAVSNVAHESYEGSGYFLDTQALKHSLNQFSKEVETANPNWRNQTV